MNNNSNMILSSANYHQLIFCAVCNFFKISPKALQAKLAINDDVVRCRIIYVGFAYHPDWNDIREVANLICRDRTSILFYKKQFNERNNKEFKQNKADFEFYLKSYNIDISFGLFETDKLFSYKEQIKELQKQLMFKDQKIKKLLANEMFENIEVQSYKDQINFFKKECDQKDKQIKKLMRKKVSIN